MAQTAAIDVSVWQGMIDFKKVPQPIVIIKVSGGDGKTTPLYFDAKAAVNYRNAKAAGKAVGLYHFAGAGDPIKEADKFIAACSPLAKDDVLILDWEVNHKDPDTWCSTFINRVKAKSGVTSLMYMNTSTENSISWSKTRATGAGLWIADYRFSPEANVPIKHWPFYAMHQYSSSGKVAGISGNVDMNVFFGTVTQFKKYGYKEIVSVKPAPKPIAQPPTAPVTSNPKGTTPPTTPAVPPTNSQPASNPTTAETTPAKETKPKVIVAEPTYYSLWDLIKAILSKIFIKK